MQHTIYDQKTAFLPFTETPPDKVVNQSIKHMR